MTPFFGQSFKAARALYQDSIRIAIQLLSLMLHIGHQVSKAVMLWSSMEAACWANHLLLLLLFAVHGELLMRDGLALGLWL